METSIERETENPLLNRQDVEAVMTHEEEATPSEAVARKALGKKLAVDPEHIRIDTIKTGHGTHISRVTAKVFDEAVAPLHPEDEEEVSDEDEETAGEEEKDDAEEAEQEEPGADEDSEEGNDEDAEEETVAEDED